MELQIYQCKPYIIYKSSSISYTKSILQAIAENPNIIDFHTHPNSMPGDSKMQTIGYFSKEIIDLLELNIENNTPILIGDSNIEHIKNRHPYEYDKYFDDLADIIKNPDYVGLNPKD